MRFYRISGPRLWGDYGSILIQGMSGHLPRRDGLIQLERTGPFVPPITFPGIGDVVVRDELRGVLEHSGLAGLAFAPVIKALIVEFRWEQWDRASESPVELPEGGEPENYILARPHSPQLAEEIGLLWEMILPEENVKVDSIRIGRGAYEFRIDPTNWAGSPLFRPAGKRHVMASEEAMQRLEETAREWVDFQEATRSA
jgi:hypothetical protein